MKHPVLTNRVRLIIWWLVWLFITSGQLLLYYYAYGSFTNVAIPDGIISLVIYSGIGLSLWFPFRYFNSESSSNISVIANLVLSGASSVTLWILINKFFVQAILPGANDYQAYWEVTFPYRVGTGVFIYGLIVLAYYLFVSLYNLSEKNAKEARLESLVKETELKMLRSQINPHFLFNSLNSVSSLTITDPEKARDMVIKLSDFMRYALSKKDEQPVSLRSELENLSLYLEIEKVRFGDRLSTEEIIEEKCLEIKMPVMLLQPLYENAIKHGVYEST
jgi:sensor histidine kinase YesM